MLRVYQTFVINYLQKIDGNSSNFRIVVRIMLIFSPVYTIIFVNTKYQELFSDDYNSVTCLRLIVHNHLVTYTFLAKIWINYP